MRKFYALALFAFSIVSTSVTAQRSKISASRFTDNAENSPRLNGKKPLHVEKKSVAEARSVNELQCAFVDLIAADTLIDIDFFDDGGENYGFFVGTNSYQDRQKANFYTLTAFDFTQVYGLSFRAYVDVPDSSKTVTVRIYDGTGGVVGTELGSAPVSLLEITDTAGRGPYVDVLFASPVQLPSSKQVFMSIDFSNLDINADEYFAIPATIYEQPTNFAWEQWEDETWHDFKFAWNWNTAIEMYPILCGEVDLPVKLSNLSAQRFGSGNRVQWTTQTESANKGFEIQRSADGINFTTIGFVASQAQNGNSVSSITYSFVDEMPLASNNYYRIKQVDLNAHVSLSKTLLVIMDKTSLGILNTYPNPAKNFLRVTMNLPTGKNASLSVIDMSGKIINRRAVEGGNVNQTINLDISTFAKGTYMLKLDNAEGSSFVKFVKD